MVIQKFKQFRYYNDTSNKNFPVGLTKEQLETGECFDGLFPAVEIGISALPGTKFYLNNGVEPVIVNFSGLFDLNFTGSGGIITGLKFDIHGLNYISDNDSAYLLIDIVYYESEGE